MSDLQYAHIVGRIDCRTEEESVRLFPTWRTKEGEYERSAILQNLEELIRSGGQQYGLRVVTMAEQPRPPFPHWQQSPTLYYVLEGKLAVRIVADNSTFFLGAECFNEGVIVLPRTPLLLRGTPEALVAVVCGESEIHEAISPPVKEAMPVTSPAEQAAIERFIAETGGAK